MKRPSAKRLDAIIDGSRAPTAEDLDWLIGEAIASDLKNKASLFVVRLCLIVMHDRGLLPTNEGTAERIDRVAMVMKQ